jgi:hypothetical protein
MAWRTAYACQRAWILQAQDLSLFDGNLLSGSESPTGHSRRSRTHVEISQSAIESTPKIGVATSLALPQVGGSG